jgi:glutamate N-acetyltransferase / amino-acid N-acetyltransferase
MDITSQVVQELILAEAALPQGFRFAAVRAGIKASGNLDLACAVTEEPATAVAMFTSNRVVAAPIIVGQRHLERSQHRIRVLMVNAGNANCATGEAGIDAAQQVCARAGEVFACDGHAIVPSSTGIIGVPLPQEKLIAALPALKTALGASAAHLEQMARAIMTTDTRPKIATASVEVRGKIVRLAGIAKGAGMIHPQLVSSPHATMLAYVFTDAAIEPDAARRSLERAVEPTFNRISVDGDTSTNDTILLWASGASGARVEVKDRSDSAAFSDGSDGSVFDAALHTVCLSLAKQIVADGEGVQHAVELNVCGASTDADALRVARSIAHSPLVKTAWAGCDPNWGRILAAIGYSGVPIDPARVNIFLGEMEICLHGGVSPRFNAIAAHEYLKQPEITIRVDLGSGHGTCRFWTTDLTADYVRINADYHT